MAVSMRTKLKIKGSNEELLAIIGVLKNYATVQKEQYHLKHDCCYLGNVKLQKGSREYNIERASDREILAMLPAEGELVEINCVGPYGAFCDLTEVTLFEDMAVAAPTAYFTGDSEGTITPLDLNCHGILTNGMLHLSAFSESEMQWQSGVQNDVLHATFDPINKEYTQL